MLSWIVGLVWLICSFSTSCECNLQATAKIKHDCYKKMCLGKPDSCLQLLCCGNQPFNPAAATCCEEHRGKNKLVRITEHLSEEVSDCCGLQAYNKLNEICCESTILDKPAADAKCCGNKTYDVDKQLCCGSVKTVLNKTSSDDDCCGLEVFNKKTQCCCETNHTLHIKAKCFSNCKETCGANVNSCPDNQGNGTSSPQSNICGGGVQQQKPRSQLTCPEAHTAVCGSTCYNPNLLDCCVRNNTKPNCEASGHCGDAPPTVFNPRTHFCCHGHVIDKNPWTEFPCSPGKHCCGGKVYNPETHICCNQHRWHKGEHIHCCGAEVYNISDPQMKCCAGTLYNLTSLNQSAHEAKCCGSILLQQHDVCCLNGDKELLYSAKKGFKCCSHLYYNPSLWSCCAGELHPVQRQGQSSCKMCEMSRLLPINNLSKARLCEKVKVGTVQSVTRKSLVLINVLEISGKHATVKPLPAQVVTWNNSCKSLNQKLKPIPSHIYFFDDVTDFFTDFNDDSLHQSLHYILDKCSV